MTATTSFQPATWSAPLNDAEAGEFIPFLEELLELAEARIRPLFLSGVAVDMKADASPVTEADRAAEAAMRERITARFPGHGVLGEEFGEQAGGRYRWVLDPIDGTRAFITHCFLFGTLVALERDDGAGYRPVLGAIAHPAAGVRLIGHLGATELRQREGSRRRVQVRADRPLAEATVLATVPDHSPEQGADPRVGPILRSARLARTWGDCFGYFALATGGADAMLDPVLSYWDVAAILPVIEGAGAVASAWNGGSPLARPSLLAATPRLHAQLRRQLDSQP
jgi:myo-inositol-1(or 4)-monophosphatase